jgi:hypothetical protein
MDIGSFFSILVGVGASSCGAWVNNIFSERRRKIDDFNKAAATFRSKFVDIIFAIRKSGLQPGYSGWYKFLHDTYTDGFEAELEKARIEFETYLLECERTGFDAAWDKYINWERYFQENKYYNKPIDFLGHLNSVLHYAKRK